MPGRLRVGLSPGICKKTERIRRMKFTDFVNHEAMSTQLESLDKEDVIRELITGLVTAGEVPAD